MTTIICTLNNERLDFSVCCEGQTIYLFSQPYDVRAYSLYKNGLRLSDALQSRKRQKSRSSIVIVKVSEKLMPYIRYIEKEYKITVLPREKKEKYNRAGVRRQSEKYEVA